MKVVSKNRVQTFQRRTLLLFHISALFGFYCGLKTIDFFIYDEQPYLQLREEMEDEYWAKHGTPTEIQPQQIESFDPEKKGIIRNSWIQIVYDKDTRPYKEKYLDK